jgi:hypothetical protein
MADNIGDWADQYTLGDLAKGVRGGLQQAATWLNKYERSVRPTSFQEAAVGTPFVLNGKLGYKNASGQFQLRGDMDEGPESPSSRPPREAPPDPEQETTAPKLAPGLTRPDAYGDPAERARESEMRRMMQQYASKEYWATEEGKAKRDLALQDRYEGKDLAGYYGAQKAVGIGGFDEVISGLEQRDARYAKGGDLRAWAEANKDLALREYLKQFPAMEERGGPDRIAVEQAMKDGTFYAADGSPNPLGGKSQLVAGIDPGITMGPPAGINAEVNRRQTAAIQARLPQAAATDTGTTTAGMQPLSAVAQGFQQPAEPLAAGNIPAETLSPAGVDLRERYKRMIQNGVNGSSLYGGGR